MIELTKHKCTICDNVWFTPNDSKTVESELCRSCGYVVDHAIRSRDNDFYHLAIDGQMFSGIVIKLVDKMILVRCDEMHSIIRPFKCIPFDSKIYGCWRSETVIEQLPEFPPCFDKIDGLKESLRDLRNDGIEFEFAQWRADEFELLNNSITSEDGTEFKFSQYIIIHDNPYGDNFVEFITPPPTSGIDSDGNELSNPVISVSGISECYQINITNESFNIRAYIVKPLPDAKRKFPASQLT